ncbi:hypothetical protein SH528x_000063 [Novipirellula sp. SH528]|uniref:hypothetical protein n=1 Tax=Novipirellula sp. SH528 TaxID=3454466 RepID=UPI003FA0593B
MTDDPQADSASTETKRQQKRRSWFMLLVLIVVTPIAVWTWVSPYSTQAQHRDPRPSDPLPQPAGFAAVAPVPLQSSVEPYNGNFSQRNNTQFGPAPVPTPSLMPQNSQQAAPYASQSLATQANNNRNETFAEFGSGTTVASPQQYRPVFENSYREEVSNITVPFTDPSTGKTSTRTETITRRVPVQQTRMVPVQNSANGTKMAADHDAQIMQIVQELRGTPITDANRDAVESKLTDLRERLEAEFKRMHQRQATEIETTEQRLDNLKEIHKQRGDNQAQIVQRRIDQLLGRSDPLDWNFNPPAVATSALRTANSSSAPASDSPLQIRQQELPVAGSSIVESNANPNQFGPSLSRAHDNAPSSGFNFPISAQPDESSQQPQSATRDITPESQEQPQLSNLNEIFAIIANAGEAVLTEQSTKVNLNTVSLLHGEGAVPENELRKATLEHETAKKRAEVLKLQLRSIQQTLTRELEVAEQQLADVIENEQSRSSPPSESEALAAKRENRKARSAVDAARETLTQFGEALQLVPFNDETPEPAMIAEPPQAQPSISSIDASEPADSIEVPESSDD